MAKSVTPKGGPSRIRFVMLEADVQDGDLSQITLAIQNAFRSSSPSNRSHAAAPRLIGASSKLDVDPEDDAIIIDDEPTDENAAAPPSIPKASRKRVVAKTPDVLNDIDTESAPSLKDFISQFDVKTGVDKNLVIALWFRDARDTAAITVDHVYTCFRLLGWSTASADFSKTLRNLRDEQSMSGDSKGYSLTLVGAGKIESKKRNSA